MSARNRHAQRGLATLDVLLGMAIFALVVVIGVQNFNTMRNRAYVQQVVSDAKQAGTGIEAKRISGGTYQSSIPPAVEGVNLTAGVSLARYGVAANGESFSVCAEHVRGPWAAYDSIKGTVTAHGSNGGCASWSGGSDPTPPTPDPTATPTTPVSLVSEDEYDNASFDYTKSLVTYPSSLNALGSGRGGISTDGSWILFTNQGRPMANGVPSQARAYLRNRITNEVVVIDRLTNGNPGTGNMYSAVMTPTASYVAFAYHGQDLLTGGGNSTPQYFVWERSTGTIDRIDAPDGTKSLDYGWMYNVSDISDDGRYLAFQTGDPKMIGAASVGKRYVRYDRQTNTTVLIDHAPDGSPANSTMLNNNGFTVDLTPDGQRAVFTSTATNLDPRATLGKRQVYTWRADTGEVELVSRSASNVEAANDQAGTPRISADGRYVAWTGVGPDITGEPAYASVAVMRDMTTGVITIVSKNGNGTTASNANVYGITPDGSKVLYVSASSGTVSNKVASAGGWHIYLWNRTSGTNRSVDRRDRNAGNLYPVMSPDAGFVAFEVSESANYPANAVGNGTTDVVVWNAAAIPTTT